MHRILFLSLAIFLSGDILAGRDRSHKPTISPYQLQEGEATIFIHGTLFTNAIIPKQTTSWLGIKPATECGTSVQQMSRLFGTSYDSFYFFRWTGRLSPQERKNAAQSLATLLRNHKGPVTLICHSHGCNVALLLAELNLPDQTIDKLILLAPPVQKATAQHSSSPLFKKVISLYSSADIIQVADPQGLQSKDAGSLFSKRIFGESPRLIQARIFLDKYSPSHIDFITPRFWRKLPAVIAVLEEADLRESIVTIPTGDSPPQIIHKDEVAYVPRTVRHCSCKRFLA